MVLQGLRVHASQDGRGDVQPDFISDPRDDLRQVLFRPLRGPGVPKTVVETGEIPLGWRIMYAIMKRTMFLLPKSTRADGADERGW